MTTAPDPRLPMAVPAHRPLLHDEMRCPDCSGAGEHPDRRPCRNCLGFGTVPLTLGYRP